MLSRRAFLGTAPLLATRPQVGSGARAVVEELYDAYRALDVERMLSVLASDIIFEDPTARLRGDGLPAMRRIAEGVRASYGDIAITVHHMVACGDAVATEQTVSGRIEQTGGGVHQVNVRGASFFRIRDRRIVRWTDYFDFQTFKEQTSSNPAPMNVAEMLRQLDFWVGQWDVRLQDGTLVGTDVVEKTLDGRSVLEHWTDVQGNKGESVFYFHPAAGTWKQVWTTPHGQVKEKQLTPSRGDDSIRFVGHAWTADGRMTHDRTTLTRRADGTVRQVIELSIDDGTSWRVTFDAIYRRRPA